MRDLESTVAEIIADFGEQVNAAAPLADNERLTNNLTKRELEILCFIADGFTNRQIAERLFLAVGTVKFYASQIYSKLHVRNRVQAVARAKQLRLLS
jgi:LuxR family maltose regulon positive regulatory protein